MIALSGYCDVHVDDGSNKDIFLLNSPEQCLILEPEDWHMMRDFSKNCILLIAASAKYDPNDYIHDKY